MKSSLVLVTGVTGFIGAELARQLLEAGHRVRGTTRDIEAARADGHVTALPGAGERLDLVGADLLDVGSLAPAVRGCEYAMHVASPYVLNVVDPERDLLRPAVEGTTAMLDAAARSDGVRRVVLTSSFVAMMGDPRGRVFTEGDWNDKATLDTNPYAYSKAAAERAAWDFMDSERPQFDLVVINPAQVIGPTLVPRVNQTHEWFIGLTNGSQPAIISYDFPTIDVRDVARLHIRAMEVEDATGRHLAAAWNMAHRQIAEIGRRLGYDSKYRFPRLSLDNPAGNLLARVAIRFQPSGTRDYLKGTIGRRFDVDNSKARHLLGRDFIPVDRSIEETWLSLDHWGLLGS